MMKMRGGDGEDESSFLGRSGSDELVEVGVWTAGASEGTAVVVSTVCGIVDGAVRLRGIGLGGALDCDSWTRCCGNGCERRNDGHGK